MKKFYKVLENAIYAVLIFGLPFIDDEDYRGKALWGIESWLMTLMFVFGAYAVSPFLSGLVFGIIVSARLLYLWWQIDTKKEKEKLVKKSLHP